MAQACFLLYVDDFSSDNDKMTVFSLLGGKNVVETSLTHMQRYDFAFEAGRNIGRPFAMKRRGLEIDDNYKWLGT